MFVAFFAAGFVTALGFSGLAYSASRLVTLKPDIVYNIVIKRILNNDNSYSIQTQELLGNALSVGDFRAYSYVNARWRNRLEQQQYIQQHGSCGLKNKILQYYQPKRLQLFFSLNGSKGNGIVSCEVENQYTSSYKPKFVLLAVDNLNTQQRIVLYGDTAYAIYKGIIKLR